MSRRSPPSLNTLKRQILAHKEGLKIDNIKGEITEHKADVMIADAHDAFKKRDFKKEYAELKEREKNKTVFAKLGRAASSLFSRKSSSKGGKKNRKTKRKNTKRKNKKY